MEIFCGLKSSEEFSWEITIWQSEAVQSKPVCPSTHFEQVMESCGFRAINLLFCISSHGLDFVDVSFHVSHFHLWAYLRTKVLLVCNFIIMSSAQIKTCYFIDNTKSFLKHMKWNYTDDTLTFASDVLKQMNAFPPVALYLNNKWGQKRQFRLNMSPSENGI